MSNFLTENRLASEEALCSVE